MWVRIIWLTYERLIILNGHLKGKKTMKYNLKKITLMFLIAICLFILPGSTSVNWSVAGTIGIGGSATLSGTISNGTGFIRNISESETYISSGMQP